MKVMVPSERAARSIPSCKGGVILFHQPGIVENGGACGLLSRDLPADNGPL